MSLLNLSLDNKDIDGRDIIICKSPCKRFIKYNDILGSGSIKLVYRGLDTKSSHQVAWSERLNPLGPDYDRILFRKEALLMRILHHPNIVNFYSFWDTTLNTSIRNVALITELMTFGTLRAYIDRYGSLEPYLFLEILHGVLNGLEYLHSRKPLIVHRDIKPANLFITGPQRTIKIGDFGLSILKTTNTVKGIVGTPEFMAPEIYSGEYDESVDVYAVGMSFIEIVTDNYAYSECKNKFEIRQKLMDGIKPNALNEIADETKRSIIEWCIEHDSKNRPTCSKLLSSSLLKKLTTETMVANNRDKNDDQIDKGLPDAVGLGKQTPIDTNQTTES